MSPLLRAVSLGTGLVLAASVSSAADVDDGSSGSIKPRIPEPLYFDLVRPLGAEPGEFEVNSLFRRRLSGRQEWAPEVEYATRGGWAFEFELPLEGLRLESYKVGTQKTFGTLRNGRYIHGWQSIVEWNYGEGRWDSTQLYLCGYRFSRRWSTLSLNGLRIGDGRTGRLSAVANNSLFRDVSRRLVLGVETNAGRSFVQVLPQAQWRLPRRFHVQFSLGVENRPSAGQRPVAVWRLIREL